MSEIVFFVIWACGSSWTLRKLADISFHGGAVVSENNKWSIVGKFDINTCNLAVMSSIWGTAKINEMRFCSKWCLLSEQNRLMIQERFGAGSWHWEPRTFSVQLLIVQIPAELLPIPSGSNWSGWALWTVQACFVDTWPYHSPQTV